MKPNDIYETAELFSAADFEIYLKYSWTLLDVKKGDDSCPVIFLMGRVKKEEQTMQTDNLNQMIQSDLEQYAQFIDIDLSPLWVFLNNMLD